MSPSARAATIGGAPGSTAVLDVSTGTVVVYGSNATETELIVGNHGDGAVEADVPLQRSQATPHPEASRPLTTTPPPRATEIHKIERYDRLGDVLHEYQQVA